MDRLFAERRQRETMDSSGIADMMGNFNDFLRSPTVTNRLELSQNRLGQLSSSVRAEAAPALRTRDSSVASIGGRQSAMLTRSSAARVTNDDSMSSFLSTSSTALSRKRRAEEIDARANLLMAGVQNSCLETEVSGLQTSLKRVKTEQECETSKHSAEVSRLQKENDRVIESLRDEKASVETRLKSLAEASNAKELRLEEELKKARAEIAESRALLEEKEEECSMLCDDLEQLRQQRIQQTNLVQTELDIMKEESELWKHRYEDSAARVHTLVPLEQEVERLHHDMQVLRNESQLRAEDSALHSKVSHQLNKLDDLENKSERLQIENTRLKMAHRSNALQEEKILGLESKLSRAEKRAADYEKLQLEHQELLRRHERWSTVDKGGRPQSPTAMTRQVAELQQQQLVYASRCSTLETRCKLCESQLQHTFARLEDVEKQLITEKVCRTVAEENAARKDRLATFLSQERDGLRHILSSYQSLSNVNVDTDAELKEATENLQRHRAMVAELHAENDQLSAKALDERRAREMAESTARLCQEQLEAGLKASLQPAAVDAAELQSLRLSIRSLEEERDAAVAAASKIKTEKALASRPLKVLHFIDNPLQRRRDQLKASQVLANASADHEEIKALKEALEGEKKIRQRLEEVGKRKISELRSAYKVFLGWKLDPVRHGQYELRSAYSPNREDCLIIERNAAGDLGLQPTPLAAAMAEFIRDHLEADGAWPCFLAATTLKLAQQQQQQH